MVFKFLTLDDVDVKRRRVFLRVDINSPVDEYGNVLGDRRIRAIIPTLDELRSAKVILTSHQGRPGKPDFASLASHAKILRKYLGERVKFVEDVAGPAAIDAIKKVNVGEVLVLENVRFCSEELLEGRPEELIKTLFMRKLAPLFDVFVNDAFATVHRSQPSLVALSAVLPMVAGRLMEKELRMIEKVTTKPDRPLIAILGGAKVEDKAPAIKTLLDKGIVDKVLVAGLVGNAFLKAEGYRFRKETEAILNEEIMRETKTILDRHYDEIVIPTDVAWLKDKKRVEGSIDVLDGTIDPMDVGSETIKIFSSYIKEARTVIAAGPLGKYEVKGFDEGTKKILSSIAESKGFSIVGGGDLTAIADRMGLQDKIGHLSTGGGAFLYTISGKKLPVIEALKESFLKHKRRKSVG